MAVAVAGIFCVGPDIGIEHTIVSVLCHKYNTEQNLVL